MDYAPAERSDYRPSLDKSEGPHHTVTGAGLEDLNGDMAFRYPTAFDEVRMGARMAELVTNGGLSSVTLDQLPFRAKLYVQAIATLEFCVLKAPKGWYQEHRDTGRPLLAPGAVGEGDEEVVLEAYGAFSKWRERFRGAAKKPGEPERPETVVSGGEAVGDA